MRQRRTLCKDGLSLIEQAWMTGEERVWWLKEMEREAQEEKRAHENANFNKSSLLGG